MNIGLDVGYSHVKAITGGKRPVIFPSVVGSPNEAGFSMDGQDADADIILLEPDHVRVGQGAIEQSRFLNQRENRHWIDTPVWYDLAMAALTELTSATVADLFIVTGLPVAFYSDRKTVRDRLLGLHRVNREGRRAQSLTVSECRVIPQPFGALIAAALNERGQLVDQDLATGNVGVIDVGGKTTNLLSVNRLREVGRETASVNTGAWDAARELNDWFKLNLPDKEFRSHEIMTALVTRKVRYYDERVDLSQQVASILAPMAEQVLAEASQLWNGGAGLQAILVSGGGALLLGEYVKRQFRHARVVDDPVFANARGFFCFAQHLAAINSNQ